ncbi:MAG: FHA domain-containing protein [Lachnospiraceae bacterium]|nr:FHA domain-containing protein [Lachnospiraceae bacterium]
MNRSYLIAPGGEEMDGSYEMRILTANRIAGLLSFRVLHFDGEACLSYDITSRQSLAALVKKRPLKAETHKRILLGILRAEEALEEYLLDRQHLLLEPEAIFLNAREEEPELVYYAGCRKDFFESFRALNDFLIHHLAEEDREAILLGYRFSRELASPACDTGSLRRLLHGQTEEKEEPFAPFGSGADGEAFRAYEGFGAGDAYGDYEAGAFEAGEALSRNAEVENEKRPALFSRLPEINLPAFAAAGLGIGAIILFYVGKNLLPSFEEDSALIGLIALLAGLFLLGGCFLFILARRRKRQKKKPGGAGFAEEAGKDDSKKNRELFRREDEEESVRGLNPFPSAGEIYDLALPEETGEEGVTTLLSGRETEAESVLVPALPGAGLPEIHLGKGETVIGKLPGAADAVIDRPVVSRVHARVTSENGVFYIEDMNSRNGTFVNEVMLPGGRLRELKDGDAVRFADAGYIFRTNSVL